MHLSTPEILLILAVVILLFGVGRISKIAGELGKSFRVFRDTLKGKDEEDQSKDDHSKF